MKKTLFLIITLFGLSFNSQAQFGGSSILCYDCYWSIEAGVNSATISGMEGSGQKIGFYFGSYRFFVINDDFAIRSGASYNNLGTKVKGEKKPYILHSINPSMSLHYFMQDQKFQVFGGGELGLNFAGKLPSSENNGFLDNILGFNDTFTTVDFSVFAGAGYIINKRLDINLKYNLGLTNVSVDDDFNWKKNWLTLSVGYSFRH